MRHLVKMLPSKSQQIDDLERCISRPLGPKEVPFETEKRQKKRHETIERVMRPSQGGFRTAPNLGPSERKTTVGTEEHALKERSKHAKPDRSRI